jgi:hypothetical protein
VTGYRFFPGTPVSSTNKTEHHDTTKILLQPYGHDHDGPHDLREEHFWYRPPTLCDKVSVMWQVGGLSVTCHVTGRWFSTGFLVFSINKTDHHDITEKLLKVVLNTILHPLLASENLNKTKENWFPHYVQNYIQNKWVQLNTITL